MLRELEGHREGLPAQQSPLCKTSAHRNTVIGALFLRVAHLLPSNDLYNEYSRGMKGKDRTKEAPGYLEAEEEREEHKSSLCWPPVAFPSGCKTHTHSRLTP